MSVRESKNLTPKVSVVTPLYNSATFIEKTLDSLLAQTYTNWESLLVDDGSTDDTARVVAPYLKDARFRYFRQENQGIAAARNAGVRVAAGEWVCLLDHDDRWLPQKLEKQLRYAVTSGCQLISTDAFIVEKTSRWIYSSIFLEPIDKLERMSTDPSVDVLAMLIKQNFVCTCSVMITKALFEECGLLDEEAAPADDYDMWLRCALRAKVGFLNEPLVEYFRHASNYSKDEIKMLEKVIYALRKNSRRHLGDEKRSRQFKESLTREYDLLFRKLVDARAYALVLRHIFLLLKQGRDGFGVLRHITPFLYNTGLAPHLRRVMNSIRHRLRVALS